MRKPATARTLERQAETERASERRGQGCFEKQL